MFRGHNGRDLFFSDDDRWYFCKLLDEAVTKFSCKIHAFCLMSNHVHLLIQVDDTPLSKCAHFIAFHYACWFNDRQGLSGYVFQSRYKAILVTRDDYLLQLCRYIHLNPIVAGIVKDLDKYFWSSHKDYLGAKNFLWLTKSFIFNEPEEALERSILRYSTFMTVKLDLPSKLSFRH